VEAFRESPPAALVWAAGATFALAAVAIPSLLAAQKATHAVATLAFSAVLIGFLCWLASNNDTRRFQYQWRVIRQPMRDESLCNEVNTKVEKIYKVACDCCSKATPNLEADVRTNIFLPDFRRASQGVAFELRMSPLFHRQMRNPAESRLTFQPGQGATGEVFLTRQPVITMVRLYGVSLEDEPVFEHLISKDLKAIISIPIHDDKSQNVIAIFNIDICGDISVEYELLVGLYKAVSNSADFQDLSSLLNRFEKAWLKIGLSAS